MTRARSWLFVPGDDTHKIDKALAGPADRVILDLEDAVAPHDNVAARETLAAALREGGFLFIGPPENPPILQRYFADCVSTARIFRRRAGAARPLNLPSGAAPLSPSSVVDATGAEFHVDGGMLAGTAAPPPAPER